MAPKRKRVKFEEDPPNYKDPSSDEIDYVPPFPSNTSSLEYVHIEKLGLNFINVTNPQDFLGDSSLYKECDNEELIAPDLTLAKLLEMSPQEMNQIYPRSYKLIKALSNLVRSSGPTAKEWQTDTFVNKLLTKCKYDHYPLTVQLKPLLKGLIGKIHNISSIPDHGIEKDNVTLVINENKRKEASLASTNFGEAQIAGEALIAAQNIRKEGERVVFAIRVLSTHFTFYKAIFTEEYLKTSRETYPVRSEAVIFRYPAEDYQTNNLDQLQTLDYCRTADRQIILSLLFSIREILSQTTP